MTCTSASCHAERFRPRRLVEIHIKKYLNWSPLRKRSIFWCTCIKILSCGHAFACSFTMVWDAMFTSLSKKVVMGHTYIKNPVSYSWQLLVKYLNARRSSNLVLRTSLRTLNNKILVMLFPKRLARNAISFPQRKLVLNFELYTNTLYLYLNWDQISYLSSQRKDSLLNEFAQTA